MTFLKARAVFLLALFLPFAAYAAAPSWTSLAKKVGESEENRAGVIASLRKIPGLHSKLSKAIYTKDRPLALDVISALTFKDFVPELLHAVPADPDGFLTNAVNSMMEPGNQSQILKSYQDSFSPKALPTVAPAAIVAMLEPLGRLNVALPKEALEALRAHASPEVRSSLIYYLRIMALRNKKFDSLDLLTSLTKAPEFQVRLQAVSVSSEILGVPGSSSRAGLASRADLKSVCDLEKTPSVKSACYSFIALAPRTPASLAPQCSAMEKKLYSSETVKIRMIFGYKDARPARFVGDRHERLAFIQDILQPCRSKDSVGGLVADERCGFTRSKDNADLFMKSIDHRKTKRILLWVVNSSVGTDDQENRDDPFQRWKSKYAEEAFTTGLANADVVLYDGHSRFGGGPDFNPPVLRGDGTVDPAPYQSVRPGLTKMTGSLSAAVKTGRLKMLGLFSCSSSQHFNDEIHKVSKAGVVSSKVLMYYSDALKQSLETLSDVLAGRCPRSISF